MLLFFININIFFSSLIYLFQYKENYDSTVFLCSHTSPMTMEQCWLLKLVTLHLRSSTFEIIEHQALWFDNQIRTRGDQRLWFPVRNRQWRHFINCCWWYSGKKKQRRWYDVFRPLIFPGNKLAAAVVVSGNVEATTVVLFRPLSFSCETNFSSANFWWSETVVVLKIAITFNLIPTK